MESSLPTLWVDADSCPREVRRIIEKACIREGISLVYVANRPIPQPDDPRFSMVVVPAESQGADRYLMEQIRPGDLAVTRDIPLAAELLKRDAAVINDRGGEFTPDNIQERLSMRDFMYQIRNMGIQGDEGPAFGPREKKAFADTFDRVLCRLLSPLAEG